MNAAQVAGLSLLNELRGEFEDVHATLSKILANIVGAPEELKFRRLKTTNARIAKLLDARGARKLLIGSGFVEETDALALPEGAAIEPVQASLAGLAAQQKAHKEEEEKAKLAAVEEQRAAALRARRSKEPAATEAQTKASHILLKVSEAAPFEAIEVQLTKWKQLLDDTPHHLMQNKFAELAKEHSQCPSGARGGALGFFVKGKMCDEFSDACFAPESKVGSIVGPVRTPNGSHLIWVQARIKGTK